MLPIKMHIEDLRLSAQSALVLALCAVGPALAQEQAAPVNDGLLNFPTSLSRNVIDGDALANAHGRIGLNVAAGALNAQSNAAVLAVSSNGRANVLAAAVVHIEAPAANDQAIASATIAGKAFAGAAGMLSINQASGSANAQANIIAIGLGAEAEALSESALSSTVSGIAQTTGTQPRVRESIVSDGAFRGARGLVQVNQSAGARNRTANHFALQVQIGSKP